MDSIATNNLKRTGLVTKAIKAGNELTVTYHDKPFAVLVPVTQREEEQAELGRLRALVEELEKRHVESETGESVAA